MPKQPLKRIAALSGIGIQLAATIFIGASIGRWLDNRWPLSEKRIYTLLFVLVFTALALYNCLRQVNRMNKD